MKKLFLVVFIAFLVFPFQFLHADAKTIGEIVNLTLQHQVAFTDLTADKVAVGDVVEVFKGQEFLTYLEVIETSPAVSKLGYVQKPGLSTSMEGFNKITVGAKVIRLPQAGNKSYDAMLTQVYDLQEKNAQLTNALQAKTKEFEILQQQSSQNQEKLKLLKEKISSLKAALK